MQILAKTQVQAAVPMDSRAPVACLAEILRQGKNEYYVLTRLTFPHKFTFYFGVGARMDTGSGRRSA